MKKDDKDKNERLAFIQLAIDNPEEAGDILIKKGKELKRLRKTNQIVSFLKGYLYLSEQTIWKDYSKSL